MIKNGMLYVLITALCFATHEPASKLLDGQINPYAITAIRFLIGGLVLLPFSILEIVKKKIKLTPKDFGIMTGLGILFICVSMVLLQVAVAVADSASIVAIIFSSNSIITIIMSAIFLKVKLTPSKITGIVFCVIGVLVAADITGGTNVLSVVFAILSALTFSTYTILCKKYMTKISGVIQSGFSFVIGSVILMLVLPLFKIEIWGGVSTFNFWNMLYIAIIVTGFGYWAYFGAIKNGGPQTAALAFLIKPILTPFASFLIVGETFKSNVFVAVVFVVIGASLASGTLQNIKGGKKMKVIENISYSSIGHERQVLDLYLPDCEEFPVFVYFHGGGFEKGSKGDGGKSEIGNHLASKGIACVCANYRMYPDAVYPDFIRDGASAVAWTFKHIAEYGKCDKIFVGGTSAGAHTSMMLNYDRKWLEPHRIKIMDIAGFVHDAGQPTTHFNVLRCDGMDRRRIVVDERAPLYYVGIEPEYPPQLHLVSTNDIKCRHTQLKLIMETMEFFEYDMSKTELKVYEGRHSRYTEVRLCEVVEEFINKNI